LNTCEGEGGWKWQECKNKYWFSERVSTSIYILFLYIYAYIYTNICLYVCMYVSIPEKPEGGSGVEVKMKLLIFKEIMYMCMCVCTLCG